MQKYAFVFLAVVAALLAFVPLVEGVAVGKRVTNAQRFARGMTPLPPAKRTKTQGARDPNPSKKTRSTLLQSDLGRIKVQCATTGALLGYVNNPSTGGSFGINDALTPADDDLFVEFSGASLLVTNPNFPAPFYIGGSGSAQLEPNDATTIQFTNVRAGSTAAIWSLDPSTGALTATWTNPDGSTDPSTVVYDTLNNVFSLTGDPAAISNSDSAIIPVNIFLTP